MVLPERQETKSGNFRRIVLRGNNQQRLSTRIKAQPSSIYSSTLCDQVKINPERCSGDEGGTKMQQIYTATTFSITKTYNIELKVHRNLLNKSIGLEFCLWHLSLRALLQLSLQQQHCDVITNGRRLLQIRGFQS